ncbi:MAG: lipoprotein signal peptidase [Prevotellaceae bacterium]|jgi:signal peptidase II|nr:lipoprotein signal peptidase [Prevotellaceae bacterium]
MSYSKKSVVKKSVLIIFAILLVDQISKIYVKTHFVLGEDVRVFDWFRIYFVENPGMAFGIEFVGKLFLTLFRIVAVCILAIFIHRLIADGARQGFVLTIAMVLAGAAGNIIDSVFYGVIFSESTTATVAQFLPEVGGYAPLLHGRVVDMLYFPIIHGSNGNVLFFSPVFNIADSAITVAIFLILFFFLKDLNKSLERKKVAE